MEPKKTREITWQVVRDLQAQLEQDYSMDIWLKLKVPTMATDKVCYWVNAIAEPRTLTQAHHRTGLAVSRRWPHPDTRTLEGAAFRALWDLERRLEEQAQAAGRASAGQQRIW